MSDEAQQARLVDEDEAEQAAEPAEQDGRTAVPALPEPEPEDRVIRATPQRRQRAPMIRQPEDLL